MERIDCEHCFNSEFYDGDKLRCKLMRCNPRYEDMEDTKKWLVDSFPGSFINNSYEFILGSIGFSLRGCWYQEDIDCKVLEWISGAASEDLYILQGINKFKEEFEALAQRTKQDCGGETMTNKITEAADKIRLMTDEELIVYVENRAAKARGDGFNQGFTSGRRR